VRERGQETGDGRREIGDGRQETGDRRREAGDGRLSDELQLVGLRIALKRGITGS